ncbi:hypothetical protein BV22DRAFT_1130990 [Leucogyrophana mollusca]|uniref:Uncharacterized protein n=1 Tax=Leucogyrophana mollusca TaxID=85980 RepID=A0ACB8BC18_9AGAM|nr:hypothetical protein BV22DRAFT_1130990 [Leucogyrophana mollusca]
MSHTDVSDFADVHTPVLQAATIPGPHVPFIVQGAPIQSITVHWEPDDDGLIDAPRLLAQSTGPLTRLNAIRSNWSIGFIEAVARYLPRIDAICINNGNIFRTSSDDEAFINEALKQIVLNCLILTPDNVDFNIYSGDFATVQVWGDSCASLLVCAMHSGPVWHRLKENAWCPDLSHPFASHWLTMMLRRRQYSQVENVDGQLFDRFTCGMFPPLGGGYTLSEDDEEQEDGDGGGEDSSSQDGLDLSDDDEEDWDWANNQYG